MPYTAIRKEIVEGKERWCFRNKQTGQRICASTKEKAKAAMGARYAHEFFRKHEFFRRYELER